MTSGWGNLISLLHRRFEVLDALVEGSAEKRDLEETLDVSRSTVDRAVRELEAHDLAERTEGAVEITLLGRLALAATVSYRRKVATLERYGDVLTHLDSSAPLPPWVLVGADLYRPEPPMGNRPQAVTRSELAGFDRLVGLTKAITDPGWLDRLRETLLDGGARVDLVVASDIVDYLRETRDEDLVRALQRGALTLHERERLPFGCLVADPDTPEATVLLFVYDDGQLVGTFRSRRPAVVDWAVTLFRGYRNEADPVGSDTA